MSKVFITGISGFVGHHLARVLVAQGFAVRGIGRSDRAKLNLPTEVDYRQVSDADAITNWDDYLKDSDVVIHLLARVHEMKQKSSEEDYYKTNSELTKKLAKSALENNVKKFIFLSSIKVNGEETTDYFFTAEDTPQPEDVYARSKLLAENYLRGIQKNTDLDVTIIRVPLVYGPHVKGNFLRLMWLVQKGVPLPLASFNNRRSMLAVSNLTALISFFCKTHQPGVNFFLVSDPEVLTVPEILKLMAEYMGKASRIFGFNKKVVQQMANLLGQKKIFRRLCSSLEIDLTKLQPELLSLLQKSSKEEIKDTVEWYVKKS